MSAIFDFDQRTAIAGPNLTRHTIASSIASLADIPSGWLASYRELRAFEAAHAELMALDDRMLRDIGLDRSGVTSALLEASDGRNPLSWLHSRQL